MTSHNNFLSRPEQEMCRANFRGCTSTPEVRIHCQVEGTDIAVCQPCARTWRLNATAQGLYNRCPLCAEWQPSTRNQIQKPLQPELRGAVADAVDAALHMEGLTVDIRKKVLQRLAKDAPWLAASESGFVEVTFT